jgi:Mrp family chromosome partitioning ATPase
MTSCNLAITLALAGQRVILVDGDLRRPMVSTVFSVGTGTRGFASVLVGHATPDEALVQAPGHGDQLQLLLASPESIHLVDLLERERVRRVVSELRSHCDVVVVDSPPLTEVADALTLADECDRLNELRRMLARRGVSATGFVLTTRKRPRGYGYTYGSSHAHELKPPAAEPARLS